MLVVPIDDFQNYLKILNIILQILGIAQMHNMNHQLLIMIEFLKSYLLQ